MRAIKKFLLEMDLFAAAPLLRTKSQPIIGTVGLGFFSLILFGLFLWILVSKFINSLNLNSSQIKFSNSLNKTYELRNITNLMMAISFPLFDQQLNNIEITEYHKYFSVSSSILNGTDYYKVYLQPCKPEQWTLLGNNYQEQFNKYQLSTYLCLPSIVNISNVPNADTFLNIDVKPCNKMEFNYCKNLSEIVSVFYAIMQAYSTFPINVHSQCNCSTYYAYSKKYFIYQFCQDVFLKFNQIIINTQKSVIPLFSNSQTVMGYNCQSSTYYSNSFFNITDETKNLLLSFNAYMSSDVYIYNRTVNTIDIHIAYVGGLLGIVIIFLGFFLQNYSQYLYQIRLAKQSFNYDDNGYKIREADFTPWLYIKYSIFDWVQLLFDFQLDWKECKQLDRTRETSIGMLDVEKLFRRLQFLQKVIWRQSNPDIFLSITLLSPDTIDQVKKKRNILQYYQQVVKKERSATVEDALRQDAISFKYLSFYLQTIKSNNLKNVNKTRSRDLSLEIIGQDNQFWETETKNHEDQEQLKRSLMQDLGLEHMGLVCQLVSYYQLIARQSSQVQLTSQFVEIQKQMTEAFLKLSPQQKQRFVMKMPIILLHRLRLKAKQLKNRPQISLFSKGVHNQMNHLFLDAGLMRKSLKQF